MGLLTLHDDKGNPVYVHTKWMTFFTKSPTSKGTVVGLVGDDIGCDVVEGASDIASVVAPELGGMMEVENVEPQPRQRKRFMFERKGDNGKKEKPGNQDYDH